MYHIEADKVVYHIEADTVVGHIEADKVVCHIEADKVAYHIKADIVEGLIKYSLMVTNEEFVGRNIFGLCSVILGATSCSATLHPIPIHNWILIVKYMNIGPLENMLLYDNGMALVDVHVSIISQTWCVSWCQ